MGEWIRWKENEDNTIKKMVVGMIWKRKSDAEGKGKMKYERKIEKSVRKKK